jgi:hypothetical protein
MYAVDIDTWEIKFRAQVVGFIAVDDRPDHSYYKNFPGVTRGDGTYQIGDFNGDGLDEKAAFVGLGIYPAFSIVGYDPQENKVKNYCYIPCAYGGRSPVEFIIYKGMQGFQLLYYLPEDARAPGQAPNPDPKNGKWFFYAWDEGKREYVEVEEVDPRYIGLQLEAGQEPESPAVPLAESPASVASAQIYAPAAVAEDTHEGTAYSDSPAVLVIVLIGGAAVLAVVIVLLAVRKKKK